MSQIKNDNSQKRSAKRLDRYDVARKRIRIGELCVIAGCLLFITAFSYRYLISPLFDADRLLTKKNITYEAIQYYAAEGDFTDCEGNLVFGNAGIGESGKAAYPENLSYAYLLGYYRLSGGYENTYGLRGNLSDYTLFTLDDDNKGALIKLTTDSGLQNYAYEKILQGQEGSVTVIENSTGAIKCLTSMSTITYDVNDMESFIASEIEGSQYRRGTYENDPPGSVFKVVTAAAALQMAIDEDLDDDFFSYYDTGTFTAEGSDWTITNYHNQVYGELDLEKAMANSVNCYFANLGIKIGGDRLAKTASAFLIGENIEIPFLCTITSSFDIKDADAGIIAQTAYGQGNTEITPVHLCLIAQAIANDGVMMAPYIVSSIESAAYPFPLYTHLNHKIATCLNETVDDKLKDIMHTTALGYGLSEASYGMVYAKTGTAECPDDRIHRYIIGFTDTYSFCISLNDADTTAQAVYNMAKNLVNYLNNYMA